MPETGYDAPGKVHADVPDTESPSELVAIVFRREDDIDVAGVAPFNNVRPDWPEFRVLVGRLRDLLGDVHDAAIGMGFRHPGEAGRARDRFTRGIEHTSTVSTSTCERAVRMRCAWPVW